MRNFELFAKVQKDPETKRTSVTTFLRQLLLKKDKLRHTLDSVALPLNRRSKQQEPRSLLSLAADTSDMWEDDRDHSLSPEKRGELSLLREQDLALDKQSQAIQTMLSKLDTVHSDTTTVGYSNYSSLHRKPLVSYQRLVSRSPAKFGEKNEYREPLVAKFDSYVAASTNFAKEASVNSRHDQRLQSQLGSLAKGKYQSSTVETDAFDELRRHLDTSLNRQTQQPQSHSDGDDSVFGADIIKVSQAQLVRIREERASTLALRLQQKQEALQIAEQLRLNALHEIRHKAAMEIAIRHFTHKFAWKVIRSLFNTVKAKANYTLAAYKWKVVSMLSVLHKLIRCVRINASSDAPYLVLRQRAGWRRFQCRYTEIVRNHVCVMERDLIARNFHFQRKCRPAVHELIRLVRRRVMTGPLIDMHREKSACKKAFAVFRRRLLGQRNREEVIEEKLIRLEEKQMRGALRRLADVTRRERRTRHVIYQANHVQLSDVFIALQNHTQQRVHVAHCLSDAVHFHRETSLSRHLHRWLDVTAITRHRKYCNKQAIAHTSDIRAQTDAFWLRENARKHFHKWYQRVLFNRSRSLPAKRHKSKKFRARVKEIIKAWRLRLKNAQLKRRADRAKIRTFQLRHGWKWFLSELQHRISVLKWQRQAISVPRTRLRRKYLIQGFAHYRQFVVQCHTQRQLMRKIKKHRLVAFLRKWLQFSKARVVTRKKRRLATQAGQESLVHRLFKKWRNAAARRLKKRTVVAIKSLRSSKRHNMLGAWIARTGARLQRSATYNKGRAHCVRSALTAGLSRWMQLAERCAKLQKAGVRTVKVAFARRVTFLHRWFHFVEDNKEKRAHANEFAQMRAHKQTQKAFSVLLQPCLRRAEENRFIATYREETLIPLLLRRCLRKWSERQFERAERLADPRLRQYDNRLCRQALRRWRAYRAVRRVRAQDLAFGDRNRAIISSLRAFSRWRYLASLRGALIESARRAARAYRRRYFAPAFKNWLRNTTSLARQFDARYLKHGNVYVHKLASRLLGAFRQKLAHKRQLKHSMIRAAKSHIHSVLNRNWTTFCAHIGAQKEFGRLKKIARSKRAGLLKRIAFNGFLAVFKEAESPGFGKASRYHDRRTLRAAIRTLQAIRLRRKALKRAVAQQGHKIRRFAKRLMAAWALKFRTRKRKLTSVSGYYQRHLCKQYLLFWINSHENKPRRVSSTAMFKKAARKNLLLKSSGVLAPRNPKRHGIAPPSPQNKRRVNVDPVVVMRRRREGKVLACVRAFAVERRQARGRLQGALTVMHAHNQREHVVRWLDWMQHVHSMRVHEMQAEYKMDHFYCAKYFPLFTRPLQQRRQQVLGEEHHFHHLYTAACARWAAYACISLRRAKAQAKILAKAKEKEAQARAAPQFVDDDFSHRKFRSNSAISIEIPTSSSAADTVESALDMRDFRVSVQRAQWHEGTVMHLVHAMLRCVSRWRAWCRRQQTYRLVAYDVTIRQLGQAISMLHTYADRARHHRKQLRMALHARRRTLLQQSFKSLHQHRRMSIAVRKLALKHTSRIFHQWVAKVHYRAHMKGLLTDLETIHHRNMLAVAFREWQIDTQVEVAVVEGKKLDRVHRLHHGLDHFVYHRYRRRRQAALLLRGRKFKTHRLLRKVYSNLMNNLAVHYRTVEALKDSALYYERYHCRRVIYNLFFLRRNRIAKDYNLRNAFHRVTAAFRTNSVAVRYDNDVRWHKANVMLKRKTLRFLHSWAREKATRAKKLRVLRGTIGQRADASQLVRDWNRRQRLHQVFRCLRGILYLKFSRKKISDLCVYSHKKFHVYRSFRRLLSHARKRNLKRRNGTALYELFLHMQKRRAVSRLDINVSNRWARQQELRLMDQHAKRSDLARGMHALKAQIFGAGIFESQLGRFVEQLPLYGEDECKGSDSSAVEVM